MYAPALQITDQLTTDQGTENYWGPEPTAPLLTAGYNSNYDSQQEKSPLTMPAPIEPAYLGVNRPPTEGYHATAPYDNQLYPAGYHATAPYDNQPYPAGYHATTPYDYQLAIPNSGSEETRQNPPYPPISYSSSDKIEVIDSDKIEVIDFGKSKALDSGKSEAIDPRDLSAEERNDYNQIYSQLTGKFVDPNYNRMSTVHYFQPTIPVDRPGTPIEFSSPVWMKAQNYAQDYMGSEANHYVDTKAAAKVEGQPPASTAAGLLPSPPRLVHSQDGRVTLRIPVAYTPDVVGRNLRVPKTTGSWTGFIPVQYSSEVEKPAGRMVEVESDGSEKQGVDVDEAPTSSRRVLTREESEYDSIHNMVASEDKAGYRKRV
ncbi:hypothetical protein IWQ60_008285 [Tieghemiomyces parasiticus]|uniref:Uncharacterized protein n=1 Tax=Tieghemiomyces parasiticus TaxID=78921 RepID=A0A9W8DRR1_9FUNG|nr:hypothetical protein IWQ60_008285 [Tieghemiomyces parasiticus]